MHRSWITVLSSEGLWDIIWSTRIIQRRTVPADTPIGYNKSFITHHETIVAILPIGYWDGYPRSLSNRGAPVIVRGIACPVIGIVSMNHLTVDITRVPDARIGEEVMLLGGHAAIDPLAIAALAGIIPQQLVAGINPRIPRSTSLSGTICQNQSTC